MNKEYGDSHYSTVVVSDAKGGSAGLELHRKSRINLTEMQRVARIQYWDASGQFYLETFNTDVPVKIIQELIAEAEATIKTR